jgi:isopentenyl diphosphate isomerase/L-lactate dehydrogenase-like FMN-dependent dehydrogenase
MKKLGTSLIALGFAAAIFAAAPAEANDKTASASRQGDEQSEGVTVTAPSLPQVSGETEEQYDFGAADAYYNEHPEGGG